MDIPAQGISKLGWGWGVGGGVAREISLAGSPTQLPSVVGSGQCPHLKIVCTCRNLYGKIVIQITWLKTIQGFISNNKHLKLDLEDSWHPMQLGLYDGISTYSEAYVLQRSEAVATSTSFSRAASHTADKPGCDHRMSHHHGKTFLVQEWLQLVNQLKLEIGFLAIAAS